MTDQPETAHPTALERSRNAPFINPVLGQAALALIRAFCSRVSNAHPRFLCERCSPYYMRGERYERREGLPLAPSNLSPVNRLRTAMAALALLIAALFSAGLSHGIVWWLTAFGAIDGPYMAYRHDAIVTALLAVAVVGGVAGLVALACALASGLRGGDAWFAALQRTISGIGPLRAFFVVAGVYVHACEKM